MIVSLIVMEGKLVYVLDGWATPPGCDGYMQITVNEISVADTSAYARRYNVSSDHTHAQLQIPLVGHIVWSAEERETAIGHITLTVETCTHCGETHDVEAEILNPILSSLPIQARGKCPVTKLPLFMLPELVV